MIQQADAGAIKPFEQWLLRMSMGLLLVERSNNQEDAQPASDVFANAVNNELDVRRDRIRFAFEHLHEYGSRNGPYFVFAYIYLPHFPFLYGPGGRSSSIMKMSIYSGMRLIRRTTLSSILIRSNI